MLKKNEKLFKSTRLSSLLLLLFLFLLPLLLLPSPLRSDDCLNGFKDLTHTGTSSDTISPPFNLKWKYKSAGTSRGAPGFGFASYSDDKLQITWTVCCRHYGYDIKNYNMLWHYDDNVCLYSSDYYPSISGNKVFSLMGHSSGGQFDTTSGAMVFRVSGTGGNTGGAVNYNGLIYYLNQSNNLGAQNIVCTDPITGIAKWSRSNQYEKTGNADYIVRSTIAGGGGGGNNEMTVPCVAEDTVFVEFIGEIHAMDSRTGVSKWKVNLGGGDYYSGSYKYRGSVAYENGKIYCAGLKSNPDEISMYCLDSKTGQEVWRYKVFDSSGSNTYISSPIVSNGVVYFGAFDGFFYALDAGTGAVKWKYLTEGKFSNYQIPAISGNIIYFGTDIDPTAFGNSTAHANGILYGCKIDTTNPNGELVWRYANPDGVAFGPVIIGGGKLVATGMGGYVYVFESAANSAQEVIRKPRTTFPSIVQGGNNLNIECLSDPGVSGWTAKLSKYSNNVNLTVSTVYNFEKCIWELAAVVPPDTQEGMYNLEVSNSQTGGVSANSVKVIKEVKSGYYYIHISAPMNNFENLREQLNIINPEFILVTGNLTMTGSDADYGALLGSLKNIDVPVYFVPGDMDCYGGGDLCHPFSYEKNVGARYYSFNYGTHKFVGIDTTDDNGMISADQINWLQSKLNDPSDNMKTIFYCKDNKNQLAGICDGYGVNAALSYNTADSVTNSGVTPTKYIKTNQMKRAPYGGEGFSGFRVIKISNNNVVSNAVEPANYTHPLLIYSYANKYDGSSGNDGEIKSNVITLKNWHFTAYDNAIVKFVMPSSGAPFVANNGEVANSIDMGNGTSICYVKTGVTASTSTALAAEKIVSIGTTNPAGYSVTYYKDKAFAASASVFPLQTGSATPTRMFVPPGRMYFKVFAPDGKTPSFSINQPGTVDYVGQCQPVDGSGLLYSGYYDVKQEDGSNYVDGETEILINGIAPDIGNIFRIKTRKAYEPVLRTCEYSETGGNHITIECSALTYWNYPDSVMDFGYELASRSDVSYIRIYRKAGNEDWANVYESIGGTGSVYYDIKWSDTNITQGVTYKYRGVTVGKMGLESAPSKEIEVTAGGPLISDNYELDTNSASSFNPVTKLTNCGTIITNLSNNSATIIWTTNVASTTQVECGLVDLITSPIGDVYRNYWLLPEDANLVTTHCVTISNLTPGTSYGARVISRTLDGKTNSFSSRTFCSAPYDPVHHVAAFILYPGFTTLTNVGAIASITGSTSSSIVLPGDSSVININAIDGSGNITVFPWATSLNFSVTAGGGSVSPTSVTNSPQTTLTTSTIVGVNTVKAVKTTSTPMTTTVNVTSVNPHHYKIAAATISTVTAGVPFEIKITAYSAAAEIDANILPLTMTNKSIALMVVDPNNTSTQLSDLFYAPVYLKNGVITVPVTYNMVETAGIKIKAVDSVGNSGISELFMVAANSGKKWTVNLTSSKSTAVTGETVTITGKILDFYGNKVKEVNQTINLARLEGDGTLSAYSMVTDASGEAQVTLMMGTAVANVVEGSLGTLQKSTVYVRANTATTVNVLPLSTVIKVGAKTDIQIEAKDAGGNPVAGVEIGTSVVSGAGTMNVNTATTNSSGIATCVYFGNTIPAVNSVKAEILGTGISKIANINTITGDLDHYKVEGPASAVVVGAQFSVTISAMDKYNNLVNASNGIGLIGTMAGYPSSLGRGALSVVTANLSGGSTTVTNETYDRTDQIQVKAFDSNGIFGYGSSVTIISSSSVAVLETEFKLGQYNNIPKTSKGAVVSLVAYTKDAGENTVSGAAVTFSVNKGSLSYSTMTSDANGRVKNDYTVGEGVCIASISSQTATRQLTIEGIVPAVINVDEGSTIVANLNGICYANITIKDAGGNAIPNGVISYTKTSGTTLTSTSPLSPVVSDLNGRAMLTFMISTADSNNVVRLTAGTVNYDVTVKRIAYYLSCSSASSSAIAGSCVTINTYLYDSSYQRVSGGLINFSVISGGGSLSALSGVTNASGATTVLTLGPSQENNIVQAEYSGMKLTVTVKGIQPGSITVSANNKTISVGGSTTINVSLYDINGAKAPYVVVNFSKLSGLGYLSASSATTGWSGTCTVVLTAGAAVGNTVIEASSGGVSGTVTVSAVDASDLQAGVNPGIIFINTGKSEIKAVVKDSNGYPLLGTNVIFSVAGGSGNFGSATSVTIKSNATGTSCVTFANTTTTGDSRIGVASGTMSREITVKSINALTGCKLNLAAPASIQVTTATLYTTNNSLFAQVVNSSGEGVATSGTTVTFTATGGQFKYYYYDSGLSKWVLQAITPVVSVTDNFGRAYLSGSGLTYINFYPAWGSNSINVSSALGSAAININGVLAAGTVLDVTADPLSVKPGNNSKITARLTSSGEPVIGSSITFGLVSKSGSIAPTSGTSDANGEVTCILSADNVPDMDYTVKATGSSLVNVITVSTSKSTLDSFAVESPESVIYNNPFNFKIKALDANGGPVVLVSPVTVTISAVLASDGTTPGTGTLNVSTTIISNNIDSSITLPAVTYSAAENIKIKVTGGGKTGLSDAILFTKPANSISMVLFPATCVAAQAVLVDGTIKDVDSKGVSGKTLTIVATGGTLDKTSCVSDVDGKFSFMLTTPSSIGTTTVTVTSGSIVGTTAVTTTGTITSYTVTAPAVADINGFNVTITAKDSNSNLVKSSPIIALTTNGTGTLGLTSVRLTDGVLVFSQTYSKVEGPVKITAKDGNNKSGITGNITMANSMPVVLTITPSSASNLQANTITITGLNFYAGTSSSSVTAIKLGTATNLSGFTCISDSVINSAVVPLKTKAGTYDVIVYTPQGSNSTSTGKLTLTTTAPVITTITPNSSAYSQSVTVSISGSGFFAGTNSSDVSSIKVGGTTITTAYTVASDTNITGVVIPNTLNTGTYNVVVTTGGGDSSGTQFTVSATPPRVTDVSPNSGYKHLLNTINIYGNGFFAGAGSNSVIGVTMTGPSTVTINPYIVVSDTEIQQGVVPTGITAGTYNVIVTTSAGSNTTSTVKYAALTDSISPTVVTATANGSQVLITFSEDLSLATATNKGNYVITSPIGAAKILTSATISYANKVTTIGALTLTSTDSFSVTVTGVQDLAGNTISGSNIATGTVTAADYDPPTATTITINNNAEYTNNQNVILNLEATDAISGMSQMQFSNDGSTWSTAEAYATIKNWNLASVDGTKTVYVKYKDNAGNWTGDIADTIIMDATAPAGTVSINSGASLTMTIGVTLSISARW